MAGLIQRNGIWWPEDDTHCHRILPGQVKEMLAVMPHVRGRAMAVQAGGNVGLWPIFLAERFDRVVTAEPDADNYSCLCINVPGNVTAMQVAFGAAPAEVGMRTIADNCGAHWIEGPGDVLVITIDSLGLPACDLIALDVEGYELRALQGAAETIRAFRPVIVFEDKGLAGQYYGEAPGAVVAFLRDFGYRKALRLGNDQVMVAR